MALAASGAYNGTLFHRNVRGFLVQGGDPTGTGKGGECIRGGKMEDEFNAALKVRRTPRASSRGARCDAGAERPSPAPPPPPNPCLQHDSRGVVAMASNGPKTGIGSQFYITYARQPSVGLVRLPARSLTAPASRLHRRVSAAPTLPPLRSWTACTAPSVACWDAKTPCGPSRARPSLGRSTGR